MIGAVAEALVVAATLTTFPETVVVPEAIAEVVAVTDVIGAVTEALVVAATLTMISETVVVPVEVIAAEVVFTTTFSQSVQFATL